MTNTRRRPTQEEINNTLWKACDTFRGVVDPDEYKNYILEFMFLKYLSDVWKDQRRRFAEQYGGNQELIRRKMKRLPFVLPDGCTFDDIKEARNKINLGEIIDKTLMKISEENKLKLADVFQTSFNSNKLGDTKDRNQRLKNLIGDFDNPVLDFSPSLIGSDDIIGNAYMYLISMFASNSGKKGGEFFTPHQISVLLAKLLQPTAGSRISDPTCGSGSLLISVAEEVRDKQGKPSRDFALYGQESNRSTWALCKMNMFLHRMDAAKIEWGDTIRNPKHLEGDALMQFDIVVANPPFSLDKWGADKAADDPHKRFWRGLPPKSKGDFAFIIHMVETAVMDSGRVGVIVPHGVLFRSSSEGKIRRQLIEENLLEAVIGLPANLFFGTGIPAAILIFNKGKGKNKDVLFIDASREYEDGKKQNKLRPQDIEKITATYNEFKKGKPIKGDAGKILTDKYAYRATLAEIMENDFNLNIPRYVDTFEEEEPVDIKKVQNEITDLENELADVRDEMDGYLKELGLI
ncbi:MAG TPA: type I restriction-modification system subunit M [Bacteroidetes bacterium]|nr:type I restriction-modification system subunit M [Bacteroidota bacterium]